MTQAPLYTSNVLLGPALLTADRFLSLTKETLTTLDKAYPLCTCVLLCIHPHFDDLFQLGLNPSRTITASSTGCYLMRQQARDHRHQSTNAVNQLPPK